jgi:hypothetical protein
MYKAKIFVNIGQIMEVYYFENQTSFPQINADFSLSRFNLKPATGKA